jgi:hypothetical protein
VTSVVEAEPLFLPEAAAEELTGPLEEAEEHHGPRVVEEAIVMVD